MDSLARLQLEFRFAVNTTNLDAAFFQNIGGELIRAFPEYGLLSAWVPPEQIQALAERSDVLAIGHGAGGSNEGSVTTEGDVTHLARDLRITQRLDGFGQTVAVISGGAQSYQVSQQFPYFDLPLSLQIVNGTGQGDEGTAMLEIVHDIAPKAPLVFSAINGDTPSAAIAAIRAARQSLAKVIVDDFVIAGEPLFEVGQVAEERRIAVQAGAFYTVAAGNVAQQHYEGWYTAGTPFYQTPCWPSTTFALPHRFSGGDHLLRIRVNAIADPTEPEAHRIMLQWNERWGLASRDFDLITIAREVKLAHAQWRVFTSLLRASV